MNRKYYLPFIMIGVVILAFLFGRGCKPVQSNPVATRIDTLKVIETCYKDSVNTKTITRNKYVVMWREIRFDSITPCETKLLYADTVIRVDSSLIKSLRDVVRIDSVIILSQDTAIKSLTKQVKHERMRKNFWKVFTGIALAANAVPR